MNNFNHSDSNKFNNDLIQTPKSSKFGSNILFSPDDRINTPMTTRNNNNHNNSGKFIIKIIFFRKSNKFTFTWTRILHT